MLWSEKRADWRWKREGEGFGGWVLLVGVRLEEHIDTSGVLCEVDIRECVCVFSVPV